MGRFLRFFPFARLHFRDMLTMPPTPSPQTSPVAPREERVMSGSTGTLSRRDFFKASAGGGFALGSLFGLGLDLRAAQDETRHAKFVNTREVPSVCPYCA